MSGLNRVSYSLTSAPINPPCRIMSEHLRKFLIGVLLGVAIWVLSTAMLIALTEYCRTGGIINYGGGGNSGAKINYANTISYEIKAEKANSALWNRDGTYTGLASFYGEAFAGRTTACGDVFDPNLFTAASLWHSCGTRLRVCNLASDRCVGVVANDRGPYIEGRVLDLSEAAFAEIASLSRGVVEVEITEEK